MLPQYFFTWPLILIMLAAIFVAIYVKNKRKIKYMEEKDNRIFTKTHYLMVYPLFVDVDKFDLTRHGLKVSKVTDKDFQDIYDDELKRRVEDSQLKDIEQIGALDFCYVISEERKEEEQEKKVYELLAFLTIIKPSSIYPVCSFDITYVEEDAVKTRWQITIATFYKNQDIRANIDTALEINRDFDLVHSSFDNYLFNIANNPHFRHLVNVYSEALKVEQLYLRFLMFMMMAEMLVKDDSTSGVTYKIRRVCAVLLGDSAQDSQTIYDNMNKLYEARSKLVHSAVTERLTEDKLNYLHAVACEILNTFMLGSIDLATLFSNSTKYGYGQRGLLLKEYGNIADGRFRDNIKKLQVVVPK